MARGLSDFPRLRAFWDEERFAALEQLRPRLFAMIRWVMEGREGPPPFGFGRTATPEDDAPAAEAAAYSQSEDQPAEAPTTSGTEASGPPPVDVPAAGDVFDPAPGPAPVAIDGAIVGDFLRPILPFLANPSGGFGNGRLKDFTPGGRPGLDGLLPDADEGGDFVYLDASESTGATYDTLAGFDPAEDRIDLPVEVAGFAAAVTAGSLSAATFDADLAAAAAGLGQEQALLFTPDAGDLAGSVFLIVDANGEAGYQAGEDFVFALADGAPLDGLTTDIFV